MNKEELKKIKEKALEEHIPIIMDDTLEVVDGILNELKPKRILEIGTAVGYSAICFSEYLQEDGKIDTIERDEERIKEAKENIKKVEVEEKINILEMQLKFYLLYKENMIWYLLMQQKENIHFSYNKH